MSFPADYVERVYAGVLGKLIGVYLGRPIEGWTYERIAEIYGEVDRYLEDTRGAPLVVTDDDVSGTFTFLRALPDHDYSPELTPAQIGETWLNYLIERRTILWWGGLGISTEHTAYLRLKHGVPAPASGSRSLNGTTISEQIGAQIFIDGWAMLFPGDPERAVAFARRAASVSHDGEAVYGAQVIAVMEALAFVEPDLDVLLDTAVSLIPANSTIARVIADVRAWHAVEPDWRATRELIAANYGYDKYGGACHIVPNHALIIHALLHGEGDFQRSQMIVNTCGWDTDCNAANVGCLLGIKNGLAGIDASPVDWRGPVADRLYLATADGGRAISDAVIETLNVVNTARALAAEPPLAPKDGARFHFSLPGSVQGFQGGDAGKGTVANELVAGTGERRLTLRFDALAPRAPADYFTPTFIPLEAIAMPGYELLASPTLYPGQVVRARLSADQESTVSLAARHYNGDDQLVTITGPAEVIAAGSPVKLSWEIPDLGGQPVAAIGVRVVASTAGAGALHLDWLTWDGSPTVTLGRPADGGTMWRRAWVHGVDQFEGRWPEPYRIVQNEGTGLISQGTADWTDYRAEASLSLPLATGGGLAVRVGGLRRYYGLLFQPGGIVRLVKERDGTTILADASFAWDYDRVYHLALAASGDRLRAEIDGRELFAVNDRRAPLAGGGVGLVVSEGCLAATEVRIAPTAPGS